MAEPNTIPNPDANPDSNPDPNPNPNSISNYIPGPEATPAAPQNMDLVDNVLQGTEKEDQSIVVETRALTALFDAVEHFVKNAAASYQLVHSPTSFPAVPPCSVPKPFYADVGREPSPRAGPGTEALLTVFTHMQDLLHKVLS